MTNEQSATLLRLNKQAQVAALNAVGFSDVTENSRASEFGQRIKWAAGKFFRKSDFIRRHTIVQKDFERTYADCRISGEKGFASRLNNSLD